MITQISSLLFIFFLYSFKTLCAIPLAEEFQQKGYVEIFDKKQSTEAFDSLYAHFDTLIEFLQNNKVWEQKLYCAKERFIRSKSRSYYSTDFFGFYDESKREGRSQISFYYSVHFHEFICAHYPEFKKISEIMRFFEACREIQKPYESLFNEAATELGLKPIFFSEYGQPPILLKVMKYLPAYIPSRPHYDGTVFSLFLDSTDNKALLLSPYKSTLSVDDFYSSLRNLLAWQNRKSILLIPGALLREFTIDPTPHIVMQNGSTRYAAIAFAMRPNYIPPKNEFSLLPNFNR